MTTMILIRHGQSTANIQNVFAGNLDMPLTQLGVTQAQLTAQYIADNFKIQRIYASDLSRAYATGEALAKLLLLPITSSRQLREIHAGLWQGEQFDVLKEKYADSYSVWLTDIGRCQCPCGESVTQLQQRILGELRAIAEDNPGGTVAIATHATPIRVLQCHCSGLSLAHMKNIPWVSNASVTIAEYENGRFVIREASIDHHLGNMTSQFGSNV